MNQGRETEGSMKKKKKIGIFTGYFLPHLGGVERYVDKLSSALSKIGYEIVIVTSNNGTQKEFESIKGRKVYRLPIRSIFKERYPIPYVNADYKRVIRNIENEDIDYFILNTRFHLTSLIGARMGKRNNKPVILIEHGTDHFTVGNKLLDFLGKIYEHILTGIIKRSVDRFYGVSKSCNLWSEHFSIEASGVFYNSIDASDSEKVDDYYQDKYSEDELIITYAGRLIKEKGILNLIEAYRKINKKVKTRLIVAGDGELFDMIRKKYNEEDIDVVGRLDFNHVMSLYKRTDIFVYPSLYPEGLPTSILEAGLMKCAIIATPRGGTEEVIVDGDHGIIVDGSIESLRTAINLLISNSAVRNSQSEKVMKRIKTYFNWDSIAKEVDKEIKGFK